MATDKARRDSQLDEIERLAQLQDRLNCQKITSRESEVLAVLAVFENHGKDLVYERGSAYLGLHRISAGLMFSLIHKMLISETSQMGNEPEHYRINETGRHALAYHWGIEV